LDPADLSPLYLRDKVALTEAERAAEWWRIRRGEADIVIGPRAAVFAPLPRLRLILIDEEESSAFKQERIPRYHAPTVARWLHFAELVGRLDGVDFMLLSWRGGAVKKNQGIFAKECAKH